MGFLVLVLAKARKMSEVSRLRVGLEEFEGAELPAELGREDGSSDLIGVGRVGGGAAFVDFGAGLEGAAAGGGGRRAVRRRTLGLRMTP